MVSIIPKNRICQEPGCTTIASCNFLNVKPALCCSQHKEPTMVLTSAIICQEENCNSYAYYGNLYGEPSHCCSHKSISMVYIYGDTCQYSKCKLKPSYGLPNQKAQFCI